VGGIGKCGCRDHLEARHSPANRIDHREEIMAADDLNIPEREGRVAPPDIRPFCDPYAENNLILPDRWSSGAWTFAGMVVRCTTGLHTCFEVP
jgi:hypothetical protein